MMEEQVIVYDGACRFCLWSVGRIRRLDVRGQFEYVPRQADGVEARFPKLAASDFNTGLRLVLRRDTVYVGADAVYEIYRRMPPFHRVAWLYRVPGLHRVFRMGYALVARSRHLFGRVACEAGTCGTPYGDRISQGSPGIR